MKKGYLYIFSRGKVAKINKKNGEIVWETKLEVSMVKNAIVANIQVDGDKIFIGASGKLVCIKESDGSLIWVNDLKGWGYNYVMFANQSQTDAETASIAAAAAVAASA